MKYYSVFKADDIHKLCNLFKDTTIKNFMTKKLDEISLIREGAFPETAPHIYFITVEKKTESWIDVKLRVPEAETNNKECWMELKKAQEYYEFRRMARPGIPSLN